jgi:hypothetical protein
LHITTKYNEKCEVNFATPPSEFFGFLLSTFEIWKISLAKKIIENFHASGFFIP